MSWEEQFGYIKQITDYYKTVKDAEDFLTTEEFWSRIPCIVIYRMAELIRYKKIITDENLPFV